MVIEPERVAIGEWDDGYPKHEQQQPHCHRVLPRPHKRFVAVAPEQEEGGEDDEGVVEEVPRQTGTPVGQDGSAANQLGEW